MTDGVVRGIIRTTYSYTGGAAMDDFQETGSGPKAPANRAVIEAIRSSAFGLLIGGAICLYFGFSLLPDTQIDKALFVALRIVGVAFLLAGAWALTGHRMSMVLAALTEALFALLLLVMSIAWTLEARAMGTWNPQVILLVVLLAISVGGARRCWQLYTTVG